MRQNMAYWLILVVAAGLLATCRKREAPISSNEVRAIFRGQVPATLEDPAWSEAPVHPAKLILQDMVDPRLLTTSTLRVDVQAVSDGRKVAFRLQWSDPTVNNLPGPASFSDACAVQFPARIERDVPAPQMGEEGRPVEITYWSAFWQATVNGRPDKIQAIYPRASVDHYPFEAPSLKATPQEQEAMAKRYAPAQALGNGMAGPRKQPVQDLIAEGPGTLRPAERSVSTGSGKRTETGWSVLIVRPLSEGGKPVTRSQVAFAVWEGSKQEVGSRKMRTAWIPLAVETAQ